MYRYIHDEPYISVRNDIPEKEGLRQVVSNLKLHIWRSEMIFQKKKD